MCDACPDPKVFRPERHLNLNLDSELGPVKFPVDPREIVFGFGRRKCPGLQYVDTGLWLTITRMLHTFDILPGPNGPPEEARFKPDMIS
jgi:cytochrome P450